MVFFQRLSFSFGGDVADAEPHGRFGPRARAEPSPAALGLWLGADEGGGSVARWKNEKNGAWGRSKGHQGWLGCLFVFFQKGSHRWFCSLSLCQWFCFCKYIRYRLFIKGKKQRFFAFPRLAEEARADRYEDRAEKRRRLHPVEWSDVSASGAKQRGAAGAIADAPAVLPPLPMEVGVVSFEVFWGVKVKRMKRFIENLLKSGNSVENMITVMFAM